MADGQGQHRHARDDQRSDLIGNGIGRPLGLLSPSAGIPICDASEATPAGQFSWMDLVQLKFELSMQWHAGASYLMNQRTAALLLTMADGLGRPLLQALPQGQPAFTLAGSPIVIAS